MTRHVARAATITLLLGVGTAAQVWRGPLSALDPGGTVKAVEAVTWWAPSLLHAAALALLATWAVPASRRWIGLWSALALVVMVEIFQLGALPVVGRGSFDPADLVAAIVGIALVAVLARPRIASSSAHAQTGARS